MPDGTAPVVIVTLCLKLNIGRAIDDFGIIGSLSMPSSDHFILSPGYSYSDMEEILERTNFLKDGQEARNGN